jgi:hypothetical protein
MIAIEMTISMMMMTIMITMTILLPSSSLNIFIIINLLIHHIHQSIINLIHFSYPSIKNQFIDSSYPSIYTASKHLVKGIFPVKKIFPDLGGIPHDLSGTYQS